MLIDEYASPIPASTSELLFTLLCFESHVEKSPELIMRLTTTIWIEVSFSDDCSSTFSDSREIPINDSTILQA